MNNVQTQLQLQTLVHTTFSCITYLRNIFTEECYETVYINSTPLKHIKNNQKTSLFLSLLEKGIYDTINKKYLRSFTVGIYNDIHNPTTLVESYTFDIRYDHFNENNFIPNIKKFCLVLQKLDPLPVTKYLTVKLVFTDDTPENYQPYGFKDGHGVTYDYKTGENVKFNCQGLSGIIPAEIHILKNNNKNIIDNAILKNNYTNNMQIKDNNNDIKIIGNNNDIKIQDNNKDIEIKDIIYDIKINDNQILINNKNSKVKDNKKDIEIIDSIYNTKKNNIGNKQVNLENKVNIKDLHLLKNNDNTIETKKDDFLHNKSEVTNLNDKIIQSNNKESVRCTCLINADHFDMIYCDTCTNWLHTVCCGYFSNNDKRIPKDRYKCAFCTNEITDKLSELSIIRRLLAVLYNEKYQGKEALSTRMGIKYNKLNKLFNRLSKEGFIKVQDRKKLLRFEVIKNDKTKSKLKKYFRISKTSIPLKDIESN